MRLMLLAAVFALLPLAAIAQNDLCIMQERPLAEQGNVSAQRSLGDRYYYGECVPQDYAEAAYWFWRAAEQGHAYAQYKLGFMYQIGRGVPWDNAKAMKWFRLAAEQGFTSAQYQLGDAYLTGRGLPRDDARAVLWFRLAAEHGYALAQYQLGHAHLSGRGLPEANKVASWMWFVIAAKNGHAYSRRLLQMFRDWPLAVRQEGQRRAKVCMASDYKDCDWVGPTLEGLR